MKIPGPFKTPPEGALLPLRLDPAPLAELPDAPLRGISSDAAPSHARGLHASRRSGIPPFEVMQITEEVARRRAAGRNVVSLCAGEPSPWEVGGEFPALGYTGPLGTGPLGTVTNLRRQVLPGLQPAGPTTRTAATART